VGVLWGEISGSYSSRVDFTSFYVLKLHSTLTAHRASPLPLPPLVIDEISRAIFAREQLDNFTCSESDWKTTKPPALWRFCWFGEKFIARLCGIRKGRSGWSGKWEKVALCNYTATFIVFSRLIKFHFVCHFIAHPRGERKGNLHETTFLAHHKTWAAAGRGDVLLRLFSLPFRAFIDITLWCERRAFVRSLVALRFLDLISPDDSENGKIIFAANRSREGEKKKCWLTLTTFDAPLDDGKARKSKISRARPEPITKCKLLSLFARLKSQQVVKALLSISILIDKSSERGKLERKEEQRICGW
jgi:hypothetical protein